ncbi:hypothetical protein LO762_11105 [Actinocorallia sp. API 0066]|uniref:hypothetical protein n=1 Tax=Actinocorallia sp. API 0066 TaxID=2896846 RepID=UPI001E360C31|nr:hypothetical protein [Actinocorallia sp. API 0066]MCD0449733.1 hypothetical protein [Actinocorallia sp. API 0066]
MTSSVTLADLCHQTGMTALDHLEFAVTIPVTAGIQAQGDLIVVPLPMIADRVQPCGDRPGCRNHPSAPWTPVPPEGVVLVRGADGGNPHTLVADPGACRYTVRPHDRDGLAVALFEATEPVHLLHPEHGASGCAPGVYAVRRQRELYGRRALLVAD